MKYRLLSIAEEDLAVAAAFYERQATGLGGEFLDEFEAALTRVCRFPEAWHPISRRHRRCLLRRFPFAVLYTITANGIIVSGVMDLRMDPARQQDRMKET
jgi:hypothetical protein